MQRRSRAGTIFVLVLILAAGTGLYFAYTGGIARLPGNTAASTLAELWETNWEGHTHPPGMKFCPKCGSLVTQPAAQTTVTAAPPPVTTKPDSSYAYAVEYGLYPGEAKISGDKYLVCVNRSLALPANYAVETEVCVTVYPENRRMEAGAAARFREMYEAALEDGIELIPFSAYRSTAQQKENFDREINEMISAGYTRTEAIGQAMRSIQPPGCSEHETGLAIDLTRKGVWRTDPGFHGTPEFNWLMNHAHDYGFILRYPQGKETVTGVAYEPWHWRYVGVGPATEMKQSGKCLEEYLGLQ
ncbi:MAG: M15 family metallopeptidase [Oscillospiraceae bacterium]|nr:M15 family metallopeptidase [Oscillospiraceae bacterium]